MLQLISCFLGNAGLRSIMPYLELSTNVPATKVPANFLQQITKLVAKSLGKPESYVVIQIVPGQMMSWGGDSETPCGIAKLYSIGKIGVAENKKTSVALSGLIEEALGIASDK